MIHVEGAALFAKRRKTSDNWVVGETSVASISPILSEPAIAKQGNYDVQDHQKDDDTLQRSENIQKMDEIRVRMREGLRRYGVRFT